jgi:hypothetical protein
LMRRRVAAIGAAATLSVTTFLVLDAENPASVTE